MFERAPVRFARRGHYRSLARGLQYPLLTQLTWAPAPSKFVRQRQDERTVEEVVCSR